MSALIIVLVVLVLSAIGVVLRLLIAELAKPKPGTAKATRKVPARAAVAAAPLAPAPVVRPVPQPAPVPMPTPAPEPEPMRAPARTAVATRPAPTAAPASTRQRKARMRDVVERGDGVRITSWRRIRSALSLVFLVAVLGAGAAAVVGGFVLLLVFVLQQAIS